MSAAVLFVPLLERPGTVSAPVLLTISLERINVTSTWGTCKFATDLFVSEPQTHQVHKCISHESPELSLDHGSGRTEMLSGVLSYEA
jgi:hypothetical protein